MEFEVVAIGVYVRPLRGSLLHLFSEYSKKAVQEPFLDQSQDEGRKLHQNSGTYIQPTWRHLPEVWNLHQHCHDSLKSSTLSQVFAR